jgi:hypothetical protein
MSLSIPPARSSPSRTTKVVGGPHRHAVRDGAAAGPVGRGHQAGQLSGARAGESPVRAWLFGARRDNGSLARGGPHGSCGSGRVATAASRRAPAAENFHEHAGAATLACRVDEGSRREPLQVRVEGRKIRAPLSLGP